MFAPSVSVGVNAPVDYDGTSALRPTARGMCPDFVPIPRHESRRALSGGHVGVYARLMRQTARPR